MFINDSKKIIFIFPSKILGGHELMALEIIKNLRTKNISVAVNSNNKNLIDLLNENYQVISLPYLQPKGEIFHSFFNSYLRKKAAVFFNTIKNEFDKIILVQGDIESGSILLNTAFIEKIEVISYLPYAHSACLMKRPLAFPREFLSSILYKRNNNYITISDSAKKDILKYNNKANIEIYKNKIRNLTDIINKRKAFVLNYSNRLFKIFIIGRVSFHQKGHDTLINALAQLERSVLKKIELNVIGDGDDLHKLRHLITKLLPQINVVFHGWMSEPWVEAYKADLLVIPSRFEGVPLVMLEALELNIDVVATARDGMLDYLPKSNLFTNESELAHLIKMRVK